ncbi:MAG: 4a-hydroxytetrahydrobiopterin dehydratase [bacterium]
MVCDLANRHCVPCQGGVPPLTAKEIAPLLAQLPGWTVVDDHHLHRQYDFDDYLAGVAFLNRIAALAEEEGHHPDLFLSWGKVVVTIYTYKIDGLADADFVLAARIDRLERG